MLIKKRNLIYSYNTDVCTFTKGASKSEHVGRPSQSYWSSFFARSN